jgi:hypothetical protein
MSVLQIAKEGDIGGSPQESYNSYLWFREDENLAHPVAVVDTHADVDVLESGTPQ